jgi:hypothetical protein
MAFRNLASTVLALFAAAALLIGGLLAYSGHALADPGAFAGRATDALKNQRVRELVAEETVREVLRRAPEAAAARRQIVAAVDRTTASPEFQRVFQAAVRDFQQAVFTSNRDDAILDLGNIRALVVPYLPARVAAALPDPLRVHLAALGDPRLTKLTDTAQAIERARSTGSLLLLLAVAAAGGAILFSTSLARGVRRAGLAAFVAAAVGLVALAITRGEIAALLEPGLTRDAVRAVWDIFVHDLKHWAYLVLALGGVATVGGWILARSRANHYPAS